MFNNFAVSITRIRLFLPLSGGPAMLRKHLIPNTPWQALFAFVLLLIWQLPISASAGDFDRFKFKPSNRSAPDRDFNVQAAPQPAAAPGEEAFKKGDRLFDEGRYEEALPWLERLPPKRPTSKIPKNARPVSTRNWQARGRE